MSFVCCDLPGHSSFVILLRYLIDPLLVEAAEHVEVRQGEDEMFVKLVLHYFEQAHDFQFRFCKRMLVNSLIY